MRPIGPIAWVCIIAAAAIFLYAVGMLVNKQSVAIGGCYAEWSTVARTVQSELCPNASVPCRAEPYAMQHNAIVDALLCACAKAGPGYADDALNKQIVDFYKANTNLTLDVRDICEGGHLSKWMYG